MGVFVKRERSVTQRRPRIGPRLSHVNIGFWRLAILVIGIAGWWLIAIVAGKNFVPTPPQTLAAAAQLLGDGTLLRASLDTVAVFLAGYVLAAVVAIPCGLLMGGIRTLGAAFEPFVDALSAMPREPLGEQIAVQRIVGRLGKNRHPAIAALGDAKIKLLLQPGEIFLMRPA